MIPPPNRVLPPRCIQFLIVTLLALTSAQVDAEMPDISSVPTDLVVPPLSEGIPRPGKRVRVGNPNEVNHILYLPPEWDPSQRWPLLVEYAGNGGYRNRFMDESHGRPEDSCLGFGLSGGHGAIWLCLPYLSQDASKNRTTWWGDPPNHDASPTVEYCIRTVQDVCKQYSGNQERVVLVGFSRGAIATFFIGLHNDQIAPLWRGFFAYSHFDGPRRWPYPGSDETSAAKRFTLLKGRPLFVCGEESNAEETQRWMESRYGTAALQGVIFRSTGYRNHNDKWILRPSKTRDEARIWLQSTLR